MRESKKKCWKVMWSREYNFVVSSFPLAGQGRASDERREKHHHGLTICDSRLTLTVKVDHHQWTSHKKQNEKSGRGIIRLFFFRSAMRKKRHPRDERWKSNGITLTSLIELRSRDRQSEKKGSIDFEEPCGGLNCWGSGARVIVIRSLCPLLI